jgi:hypothetical protein
MSPESRLADKLRISLTRLAAMAGGVAAVMEDAGIKGSMGSDDLCPAALWLSARIGTEVRVGSDRVRARAGTTWVEAALPATVSDFVARFDQGSYPELVTPFLPDGDGDS